jgi:hypothetical protein
MGRKQTFAPGVRSGVKVPTGSFSPRFPGGFGSLPLRHYPFSTQPSPALENLWDLMWWGEKVAASLSTAECPLWVGSRHSTVVGKAIK